MDGQITVVVVTWQGRDLLPACLHSLSAQTTPPRVVVVDNASTDGSVDWLKAEHPEVTVLSLERNRGFAGGVAAALPEVDTPFVALLNNDAAADATWLERSLGALHDDGEVAAVTARMLLWPADGRPDVINNAGVNLTTSGHGVDRGYGQPDGPAFDHPVDVFGFSGGAAVLRTAAVRQVGGVPARFFLYYEDADLAWRLRLAGWRIRYTPDARVRHRHAATSDVRSVTFGYYNERNRLLALLRCAPLPFALRQVLRFGVTTASLTGRRLLGQQVGDAPGFRTRVRLRVLGHLVGLAPWILATRRQIGRDSVVARSTVAHEWIGRDPR